VKISLSLSGGGFRATAYHLGVLRALQFTGHLESVGELLSVSGGSVAAAHLALRWEDYTKEGVESASRPLIALMQSDVRGRILRRRPWYWAARVMLVIIRPFGRVLNRRFGILVDKGIDACRSTSRLERAYRDESIFGPALLDALGRAVDPQIGCPPRPLIHILATNATTARLCAFTKDGFVPDIEADDPMPIGSRVVRISEAVAASSSFPAFFVPLVLRHSRLGWAKKDFAGEHYSVTDAGVFDNLGLTPHIPSHATKARPNQVALRTHHPQMGAKPLDEPVSSRRSHGHQSENDSVPDRIVIVSDASGYVDYQTDPGSSRLFTNLFRAVDITMLRNGQLYRKMTVEVPPVNGKQQFYTIDLSEKHDIRYHAGYISDVEVSHLKHIRTDCDTFSPVEIRALCQHGYASALRAVASLPRPDSIERSGADWNQWPIAGFNEDKWPSHKRADELSHSKFRKMRIFAWWDWVSVFTVFVILLTSYATYRYFDSAALWRNEAQHFASLKQEVRENLDRTLKSLRPQLTPNKKQQALTGPPEKISYSAFNILEDDRKFFFDSWGPVSTNAAQPAEPSYVVMLRTIRLQKIDTADEVVFEYRTYQGDDVRIDLWPAPSDASPLHVAALRGEERPDDQSPKKRVIIRQIAINVASFDINQEFIISIKATYVNGFDIRDWAGVLLQPGQRLRRVGVMLYSGPNYQLTRVSTRMKIGDQPEVSGSDCAEIKLADPKEQYYYWVLIDAQADRANTKIYKLYYELTAAQ